MVIAKLKTPVKVDHRGFFYAEYSYPVRVREAVAAMEARIANSASNRPTRPKKPVKPTTLPPKRPLRPTRPPPDIPKVNAFSNKIPEQQNQARGQCNTKPAPGKDACMDEQPCVRNQPTAQMNYSGVKKKADVLRRPNLPISGKIPSHINSSNSVLNNPSKTGNERSSPVMRPRDPANIERNKPASKPALPPRPRIRKTHSPADDSPENTESNRSQPNRVAMTSSPVKKQFVNARAQMFDQPAKPPVKWQQGADTSSYVRHAATYESSLKRNDEDKSLHQRSREELSNSYLTNDRNKGFSSRNKGQETEQNSRLLNQEILLHDRLADDKTVQTSSTETSTASEENGSKSAGTFLYGSKKRLIEKADNFVMPSSLSSHQSSQLSSSDNSNTSRPGSSTDERHISTLQEEESGVPQRTSDLQSSRDHQVFNSSTPVTSKAKNINDLNQINSHINPPHIESALHQNFPPAHSKIRNSAEDLSDLPNPPSLPPKVIKNNSKVFTPLERSSALHPRISHEKAVTRDGSADESSPILHRSKNVSPKVTARESKDPSLNGFNPSIEYEKTEKKMGEEEGNPSVARNKRTESGCSNISADSGFRTSLEVPPGKDVNTRWSDFDNSDEDDSVLGASNDSQEKEAPSPPETRKETNEVKLHNIAKELLSTEETYVSVLHLIDQVFHKKLREAAVTKHIVPESVISTIFGHVPAIYNFHSSFLLPDLRDRLENWEKKPQLGDIMTKAAPFLKMYSLYVQSFDEAMETINVWSEKSAPFKAILQTLQKLPESNCLSLQHHMLGPVQRVPRYKLLLADYVKRLPQDSSDREEAEKALQLIAFAADHVNQVMKKIENFQKILDIYNSLVDINFEFVDVTRELLKEGKIVKVSARNGEKHERYLYLFSDMLLCCTPLRRLQGKSYKVNAKIDLKGMNISKVKNPTVSFAFCVNGLQKSIEFATSSAEEKEKWVAAIQKAIEEQANRQQTFHAIPSDPLSPEHFNIPIDAPPGSPIHSHAPVRAEDIVGDISDVDLGTRAPRWVKDQEVTMCMICSKPFHKIMRRRHHCRACGRVVCGECSENKWMLAYDPGKAQKVCSRCYDVFTGRCHKEDEKSKGVLEVQAEIVTENSVIADYLFVCENEKKKTWTRTWCVIPQNELCLYFYGAHQDIKALMTQPLPGFEVTDTDTAEHKYAIKLKQGRKVFFLASDDSNCIERWKYALKLAKDGQDLSRDDVQRLGQFPDPEFSDTDDSFDGD